MLDQTRHSLPMCSFLSLKVELHMPSASDRRPSPREIYRMNAGYVVAGDARTCDLLEDAIGFLTSVRNTIDLVSDQLDNEGSQLAANPKQASSILAGAWSALTMAEGMVSAALEGDLKANGPKNT